MEKMTMAELAKKAGVSSATLRKYLKHENVRKDLAEKIEAAIAETGYQVEDDKTVETKKEEPSVKPIEDQASVKKEEKEIQSRHCFAFVVKEVTQPKTRELLKALSKLSVSFKDLVLTCETKGDPAREKAYLQMLVEANIQGVILDSCMEISDVKKILTHIPFVLLEENGGEHAGCVDTFAAGELLGEYLLKKHQLIIRYLGIEEKTAERYCQGIKSSYHKCKQPLDFTVKLCDGSFDDMYIKLKEILSEKIDILILEADEMVVPLQRYMKEYHISIPQNMSVVSIGGHEIAKMASPQLTTLSFDYDRYAGTILDELINGKTTKEKSIYFHVEEGESIR